MKSSLNRFLAGIACTALIAGLTVPAHAAETQPEPYTISASQWSREDFSQQANPDVFTATYDRALYNAIRQTLVDGTSDTAPAYTMVGDSEYSAVKNLLGRLEGVMRYEHHVPENFVNYWQYLDYFAVSAAMPENYQAPFDFIQPAIQSTDGMTDREKVEYLNDYLCTLLAYQKGKTAGVTRTFAQHSGGGRGGGGAGAGGGGVVHSVAVAQQAGVSIALIDFDAVGVTARHKHKFSVGRYHKVSRVRAR